MGLGCGPVPWWGAGIGTSSCMGMGFCTPALPASPAPRGELPTPSPSGCWRAVVLLWVPAGATVRMLYLTWGTQERGKGTALAHMGVQPTGLTPPCPPAIRRPHTPCPAPQHDLAMLASPLLGTWCTLVAASSTDPRPCCPTVGGSSGQAVMLMLGKESTLHCIEPPLRPSVRSGLLQLAERGSGQQEPQRCLLGLATEHHPCLGFGRGCQAPAMPPRSAVSEMVAHCSLAEEGREQVGSV